MEVTATGAYTGYGNPEKTGGTAELGKDAFFQLLITQLRYQDPLNPKDSNEFAAQMAQFTSLEQVQGIKSGMEALLAAQEINQYLFIDYMEKVNNRLGDIVAAISAWLPVYPEQNYLQLLEREVTLALPDGREVKGTVTAIKFEGGQALLEVDGSYYSPGLLVSVRGGQGHA